MHVVQGLASLFLLLAIPAYHAAEQQDHSIRALVARSLPFLDPSHITLSTRNSCSAPQAACFSAELSHGMLHVNGTSGVELASGLRAWAQQHCAASISWPATGGITGRADCLQHMGKRSAPPLRRERPRARHFYQNVVTTRCLACLVQPV